MNQDEHTVVWLSAMPTGYEGDVAGRNAYSAHSCSPHSSASDSKVKPPGDDSPVSAEKGKSVFVVKWDGVTEVGSQ